MYAFTVCHCPNCGRPIEGRLFGLCSRLGPDTVRCAACHERVDIGRREWLDLPAGSRVWFGLVTTLYVLAVGLLTGNFLDQTWQLWCGEPTIVNLRMQSPVFQNWAYAGGALVVVFQLYRIGISRRRSLLSVPIRQSLWCSPDLNLHMKCLGLLLAVWGIAKIVYQFRH